MSLGLAIVGITAFKTTTHNNIAAGATEAKKMVVTLDTVKITAYKAVKKTGGLDLAHLAFYQGVLKGIGAKVTAEKIKFLEAWRRGEGSKAKNNPFNTTKDIPGNADTKYNSVGVRNYPDLQTGLDATLATLKLSYYKEIVSLLRKDNVKASDIARCRALKKWGTGDMAKKVLAGGDIKVPKNLGSIPDNRLLALN